MTRLLVRQLLALLAATAATAGLVLAGPASAAGYPECITFTVGPNGSNVANYSNCTGSSGNGEEGNGNGNGNGSGGNATPSCTYDGIWNQFCRGSKPCYSNDPSFLQDEDYARESTTPGLPEKPSPDDHLIFVSCLPPGGEREDQYFWSSQFEEGVSTRDRLLAAYGALTLPDVTPVFNPPVRTLVNLDTWWWAEGGSSAPVVGTEALGLVAIADPQSMIVTAGGQTVTCPVVTTRSDDCTMTFRRAGDYPAEMRVTYTVRFELGGQPFTVPGGNDDVLTVESTDDVTVPVREVQSRVTAAR